MSGRIGWIVEAVGGVCVAAGLGWWVHPAVGLLALGVMLIFASNFAGWSQQEEEDAGTE